MFDRRGTGAALAFGDKSNGSVTSCRGLVEESDGRGPAGQHLGSAGGERIARIRVEAGDRDEGRSSDIASLSDNVIAGMVTPLRGFCPCKPGPCLGRFAGLLTDLQDPEGQLENASAVRRVQPPAAA